MKYGGVIRESERVVSIVCDGSDVVTVNTSKSSYQARSVILAAGPWTARLTESLGLRLPLEVVDPTS